MTSYAQQLGARLAEGKVAVASTADVPVMTARARLINAGRSAGVRIRTEVQREKERVVAYPEGHPQFDSKAKVAKKAAPKAAATHKPTAAKRAPRKAVVVPAEAPARRITPAPKPPAGRKRRSSNKEGGVHASPSSNGTVHAADALTIDTEEERTPFGTPRSRWLDRCGIAAPQLSVRVNTVLGGAETHDDGQSAAHITTDGDLAWLCPMGDAVVEDVVLSGGGTHTERNGDGVWVAITGKRRRYFQIGNHQLLWIEDGKEGRAHAESAARSLDPAHRGKAKKS